MAEVDDLVLGWDVPPEILDAAAGLWVTIDASSGGWGTIDEAAGAAGVIDEPDEEF